MKRSALNRCLVAAAVVVPMSIGTLALSSAASAGGPYAPSCKKLVGNFETSSSAALSGCNDGPATKGKGTMPFGLSSTGPGQTINVTWKKTPNTTTSDNADIEIASTDTCPDPMVNLEVTISGTVTSATGPFTEGAPVTATICANGTTGALSLKKKTKFTW